MGGRFDFDSPGAAFVDTMAKVLAERKAEERQAMLDRLTQSAEQRAMRAEERAIEQQKADQEWRTVQTDNMKTNARRQRVNDMIPFLNPDIPLEQQNLTPEQLADLEWGGVLRKRPAPPQASVSTSESFDAPPGAEYSVEGQDSEPWLGDFGGQGSPAPAPKPAPAPAPKPPQMQSFFAGTAEHQQKEKTRQQHGALLIELLDINNKDPRKQQLGQYLAQRAQANQGIIPDEDLKLLRPNKPVFAYENETGEFTELEGGVPQDTTIIQRTRPPKPPAVPRQKYIGANPQGHPIFERPDGTIFVDESVQIGGKDTTQNPLGAPNAAMEEHLLSVQGMGTGSPEAVEGFRFTANSIIEQSRIAPRVRAIAQLYLTNPAAAEQAAAMGQFSEIEKQQLARVLSITRASQFRDALMPKK